MKVWNYVVLILGILVLLDFAGIGSDSDILSLVGFSRNPVTNGITWDPSFSAFTKYVFENSTELILGILSGIALAGAGIAIGTFAKGNAENFIILPIITSTLVLFISAIRNIFYYSISGGSVPDYIGYIAIFVGVILSGGLIIALYEHFRGTD